MNYNLKAQVSDKIEDSSGAIIRLGEKARSKIISNLDTHIEVWANPFADSRLFKVKQAFNKDLALLPKNKREVAFMSQRDYNNYVNSEGYINLSPKKTTCIGSDPEFAIFVKHDDKDIIIHAADILAFDSDIGSDGPLGELRAEPGLTPEEHVNNLEKLIDNIYNKLDPNEYKCKIIPYIYSDWTYLAEYSNKNINKKNTIFTCGGHIHFGLTQKTKVGVGNGINLLIVNIIDRLISICMHRIDMDMSIKRIDKGGYGYLSDYKDENNTLEYRCLSGTWLLYKDLATIVLSIVNSLVEDITIRINSCFNDINNKDWNIENKGTLYSDDQQYVEKTIRELYPEISLIIDKYPYNTFENIFEKYPDSTAVFEYIKDSLECLGSIINTSEIESFSNLVTADYSKYKNLDSNFIENWAGGVSVFDHLNKQ